MAALEATHWWYVGMRDITRRFLAPYAEDFVEELVVYTTRASAKPALARRAPALPRPKETPSDQSL